MVRPILVKRISRFHYSTSLRYSLMSRTAAITGGAGDCVYAIPIIRRLNISTVYVKENFYANNQGSLYSVVAPLYESQGIQCLPTSGSYNGFSNFDPSLHYDIDLDEWRCRPGRDRVHIIKNMMLHYRCYDSDWNKPFLFNIKFGPWLYPVKDKNLIFVTKRWRDNSPVIWKFIIRQFNLSVNSYFIGHEEDQYNFIKESGYSCCRWVTADLLTMAEAIQCCKALFCNQGVALTIAQGLGKPYWLERKPGKTNTLFYTPNEHLL